MLERNQIQLLELVCHMKVHLRCEILNIANVELDLEFKQSRLDNCICLNIMFLASFNVQCLIDFGLVR